MLNAWSLAVEEQFYLTWPLILMGLLPRLPRSTVAALAVAGAVASLGYAELKIGSDPAYAFFVLPCRAWELLVGCALALMIARLHISEVVSEAAGVVGLASVLISFWALGDQSQLPGRDALPVCLGTAAMILSVERGHRPVVARLLSVKPLLFIGAISYSLYLWHWPMIALYQYSVERPIAWWETALLLAASLSVATASWRWIETPWRRPVEGRRANSARRCLTARSHTRMQATSTPPDRGCSGKSFTGRSKWCAQ